MPTMNPSNQTSTQEQITSNSGNEKPSSALKKYVVVLVLDMEHFHVIFFNLFVFYSRKWI